ncbi:cation:proton antiporter subunit C [Shewanella benthica]|uniref:cation:proton antiporter subunit C n=1 Tax=Shewanella benthica TaxID=43661 RepID=UPI000C0D87F9|nr:cation:proton antiporter subunit C [Shewanella benthica]MBE7216412.1 cation:proton antiporter subunit C [Shewanella benthica]MCL1064921.1 cation:proton antiporter subunit C [Shewanella benthica]PHQ76776.1 MAG: Na+/H+ antiporter subunit C [Shewanella sp.]
MLMGLFNYWIVVVLMMIGLYIVIAHGNLIKKIVGLTIFQTSVFIFYISMAKVDGGTAPILMANVSQYANPLPHVLILTAIVVGIATTALALALTIRIKEAYNSIEEESIQQQNKKQASVRDELDPRNDPY